jgi:iron complex outermembrane receptor protein
MTNLKLRDAMQLAFAAGAIGALVPAGANAQQQSTSKDAAGSATLEEVTVTGSRIRRIDAETASPVFTLDAAAIQQSGVATMGDLVQRIPAVAGAATNPQVNNGGGDGASTISLRGLGSERTLVLLNGRRVNTGNAVDVNALPINMIERVEVLKEGAGAIYGADAIGGVVNFITRRDFEGMEFATDYGRTSRSDGQRYSGSATFGGTSDKISYAFGVNYNRQEQISANNRDFSRFALYLYSGSSFPGGSSRTPTGRINLASGSALRNQFGCASITRRAGTAGNTLADYRCFVTSGQNADFYNYQPLNLILTPQERLNGFTMMNYKIGEKAEVFAEVMLSRTSSAYQIAPLPFDATADDVVISRNSIYNPFGIDFGGSTTGNPNARYRMEALGPRRTAFQSDRKIINVGAKGELFNTGWEWDAYVGYGRSDQNARREGYLFQPALSRAFGPSFLNAGVPTCGTPTAPIAGCTPVNIFNLTAPGQAAALSTIAAPATSTEKTERKSFAANVNGGLFSLPAGEVQGAVGFEYRRQEAVFESDFNTQAQPPLFLNCNLAQEACTGDARGAYDVKEFYAEVFVPILTDMPAAKSLNVTIGSRYSDYSTIGTTTNSQVRLEYRPVTDLMLRGTWSQVFRAPTINDLYDAPAANSPQLNDPCVGLTQARVTANPNLALACVGVPRDGTFDQPNSQVTGLLTSNLNLGPEEGTVKTVGFVYDPSWFSGFSVSLDYWDYKLDGLITTLDPQTSMDQCVATGASQFCSLITRFTSGASAGEIFVFRQPTFNLGSLRTTGIDLSLKYALRNTPVGSFNFTVDVTRINKYENVAAPGATAVDYVETYSNQFGNFSKYRGLVGIGWAWQGFDALASVRYFDKVFVPDADGGAIVNRLKVPAITYVDLTLGYEFPTKTRIQLGVENLTDKQPPILYQNNVVNANTDVNTYDTRGRRFFVGVNQKF